MGDLRSRSWFYSCCQEEVVVTVLVYSIRLSQVKLFSGEGVRQESGASLVLPWHFGLEGLVQFPPHCAHAGPEPALLFELVTLMKHRHTITRLVSDPPLLRVSRVNGWRLLPSWWGL